MDVFGAGIKCYLLRLAPNSLPGRLRALPSQPQTTYRRKQHGFDVALEEVSFMKDSLICENDVISRADDPARSEREAHYNRAKVSHRDITMSH